MKSLLLKMCLVLGAFTSTATMAVEFTPDRYDIYIGDVNGDGWSDFYFRGKPLLLMLHSDIAIPLLLAPALDFKIHREGDSYGAPTTGTLTQTQLTSMISQGKLRLAVVSNKNLAAGVDVAYWKDGLNSFTTLLLRGSDITAPALLLASSNADFPLVAASYGMQANGSNFSDPTLSFMLSDINGDGRRDLAANSMVYLANHSGLFSETAYSTNQVASGPVVEEYFYDEYARLRRVESSTGSTQHYELDREDNRTSHSKTKPI